MFVSITDTNLTADFTARYILSYNFTTFVKNKCNFGLMQYQFKLRQDFHQTNNSIKFQTFLKKYFTVTASSSLVAFSVVSNVTK